MNTGPSLSQERSPKHDMDRATTRITELAAIVSRNTEEISSYLAHHSLASPSFDADSPLDLPEVLRSARKSVVEATEELKSLVQGPKEAIKSELVSQSSFSVVLRFLPCSLRPLLKTSSAPNVFSLQTD